jgi:hypothetical protein
MQQDLTNPKPGCGAREKPSCKTSAPQFDIKPTRSASVSLAGYGSVSPPVGKVSTGTVLEPAAEDGHATSSASVPLAG